MAVVEGRKWRWNRRRRWKRRRNGIDWMNGNDENSGIEVENKKERGREMVEDINSGTEMEYEKKVEEEEEWNGLSDW